MSEPHPLPTETIAPARQLSTIERAYQLAREGPCVSIDDIRRQLDREHYPSVASHLSGPTIRRQLRQLCRDRASRKDNAASGESTSA